MVTIQRLNKKAVGPQLTNGEFFQGNHEPGGGLQFRKGAEDDQGRDSLWSHVNRQAG